MQDIIPSQFAIIRNAQLRTLAAGRYDNRSLFLIAKLNARFFIRHAVHSTFIFAQMSPAQASIANTHSHTHTQKVKMLKFSGRLHSILGNYHRDVLYKYIVTLYVRWPPFACGEVHFVAVCSLMIVRFSCFLCVCLSDLTCWSNRLTGIEHTLKHKYTISWRLVVGLMGLLRIPYICPSSQSLLN